MDGGKLFGDMIFNLINNYLLLNITRIPRGFLLTPREIFEDMHKNYGVFREDLELAEDLHCGLVLRRYSNIAVVNSLNKTTARRQLKEGYINTEWQWLKAFYNIEIGEKIGKTLKIDYPPVR